MAGNLNKGGKDMGATEIIRGRAGRLWPVITAGIAESRKAGRPCILLVPEQYTLQAEKDLITGLKLQGLLDIDVLSPRKLQQRVQEQAGSSGKRPLNEQLTLRGMLIGALGAVVLTCSSMFVALKASALPWPIMFVTLVSIFSLKAFGNTNNNEINVTHTAMSAGAALMRSRLGPCAMRLYDETETLTYVQKVFGITLDKGAYLVFGFDGRKDIVANQMKYAREIMEKTYKGKDLGSKGGEYWWKNKYKFFYPGYMFHIPQAFGTLDTVADFSHIENVYWAMKKVVNTEFPDARFIGHFSHWYDWGCMLYARFIFPGDKVPPNAEEAAALYNAVWDKAIRAAIREGGVINEHHGVGLKLGRYVKDLYGAAMPVLEGIKAKLDPNGIMNPGKMGL